MLRRTALFVAFVLTFALLAAAAAHSASRDIVPIAGFRPGTIVIKTGERRLYYVIDGGRALRFPVGVGRPGKTWTGAARIEGKFIKPAWAGRFAQAQSEIALYLFCYHMVLRRPA